MMEYQKKYFTVSKYEKKNGELKDIFFHVDDDNNDYPESILSLKDDFELFIKVIQSLYKNNTVMYDYYYERVYILADLAFNGKKTQYILARDGLGKIKSELIYESSPVIRSNILISFLKQTSIPMIILFLLSIGINFFHENNNLLYFSKLIFVGLGACIGCWLSLAFRTRCFEFKEILPLLSDGNGIFSRVVFVVVFSITLALLMRAGVITIQLGNFSSSGIEKDPFLAFSGGIIMGFGEKIFIDKFQKKISSF